MCFRICKLFNNCQIQSPLDIAGVKIWLDFSDKATMFTDDMTTGVVNDGDLIYGVADKSGKGNHYKQTDSAKRPSYKVNIQNGRSANYSNDKNLICINSQTFANCTIFYCGKSVYDANNRYILGHSIGQALLTSSTIGGFYFGDTGDVNERLILPYSTLKPVITAGIISNAGYFRVHVSNKISEVYGDTWDNASYLSGNVDLGMYTNSYSKNNGYYYEVIIYDRPLSLEEIKRVEEYLNNKWQVF